MTTRTRCGLSVGVFIANRYIQVDSLVSLYELARMAKQWPHIMWPCVALT